MVAKGDSQAQPAAVLFSAGLDSAVLAADAAQHGTVQPLYVSVGLAWEDQEIAMAQRLLASPAFGSNLLPLVSLRFEMRDIYPPSHWAVRGVAPAFDTPDEDVYLEGRNIVLLAKSGVYCARAGISRVLIGPLAGNPFPDASAEFFDAMATALTIGLASPVRIDAPFATMSKGDVIRRGAALEVPFDLTLSCMQPRDGLHCGQCSKCRERRDGFAEAKVADPTKYAVVPIR
jgi:7-cyano-7-deazaguanine synthase